MAFPFGTPVAGGIRRAVDVPRFRIRSALRSLFGGGPRARRQPSRGVSFETLEPRLLLSADWTFGAASSILIQLNDQGDSDASNDVIEIVDANNTSNILATVNRGSNPTIDIEDIGSGSDTLFITLDETMDDVPITINIDLGVGDDVLTITGVTAEGTSPGAITLNIAGGAGNDQVEVSGNINLYGGNLTIGYDDSASAAPMNDLGNGVEKITVPGSISAANVKLTATNLDLTDTGLEDFTDFDPANPDFPSLDNIVANLDSIVSNLETLFIKNADVVIEGSITTTAALTVTAETTGISLFDQLDGIPLQYGDDNATVTIDGATLNVGTLDVTATSTSDYDTSWKIAGNIVSGSVLVSILNNSQITVGSGNATISLTLAGAPSVPESSPSFVAAVTVASFFAVIPSVPALTVIVDPSTLTRVFLLT
ncbi:MAG: LEPR-XLL domain-containing protein, partial [Pseudomonadales bacterium]|nr:LEPR-XLL domain-containing protein [Pseudomonadales bacterium]